jgi:hypothetical protein
MAVSQKDVIFARVMFSLYFTGSLKADFLLRKAEPFVSMLVFWVMIRAARGRGKLGNLPQAPATPGPPTYRIFIPNIYYQLAG